MSLWTWEPRVLQVGEGEGGGGGGGLHVPKTLPGGIFAGESGTQNNEGAVVLDDGSFWPVTGDLTVDHDARILRVLGRSESEPPAFTPDAVFMSRTAERRAIQEPLDGHSETPRTAWVFTSGFERDIIGKGTIYRERQVFEDVVPYNGAVPTQETLATYLSPLTAWDFKWTVQVVDQGDFPADQYRQVRYTHPIDGALITDTTVQAHIRGTLLPGEWGVGRSDIADTREVEVTAVLDYVLESGYVVSTIVDRWITIARLTQQTPYPGLVFDGTIPEGAEPEYRILSGTKRLTGWVRVIPDTPVDVLRDFERESFPAVPPDPDQDLFMAAEGEVRVFGQRTGSLARLDSPGGGTVATLTAYGHSFRGGSWAALRDNPVRLDDEAMDFSPHIILHASRTTVSAVRPDGELLSIPRYLFETEVLRVEPGSFQEFSDVGSAFNTWPPQWAWADCQNETIGLQSRAVAAYDPWRDGQKRGAAEGSPPRWTWRGRPGRRPALLPDSAPPAPLGLTLADVTAIVQQDEPLARFQPPLDLPLTATVQRDGQDVDVRPAVAKRILYQPASWLEEMNDRIATGGPLTLTYPPPPSPGPEQAAAAALLLRLKTDKPTIKVNGEELELRRLGHNADQKRGWHPYTVAVPVASTYTLEYTGQCSRALLCVRVFDVPATP